MKTNLWIPAAVLLAAAPGSAARLTPSASQAFQAYIANVEARLDRQHAASGTCVAGASPADDARIEPVNGGSRAVPGGLIHHWRATALVPGATPRSMLAILRDYDNLARYYAPEVVSSHAVAGGVDRATLAMRFRKQKVVTVVLDAEFEARSAMAEPDCGYSISRSTHIWQVDRPDTPRERRLTEGSGDGYLWRLNSYWSFRQTPRGLLIECEAVSLTRDVPAGLGWLILPIVESLPRASLEFTLNATTNALKVDATRRQNVDRANGTSAM